ncbi:hypothetical protein BD560DRAFT_442639 [Blakeslea trispora]|nr:hypothetical protein BD560DRAFT_442639 [Blakeslea trispora]
MGRPRKNKRKQELHPDINKYYYEADSTEEMDIYGFAPLDSILDPLLKAEKEAKKEARRLKKLEAKRQKQLLEAEQTEIVQHEPVATEEVSEAPNADIDFEIDTGVFDENISGYDYTDDFFMSSEREFRIDESEPRSSESIRVDNQQKWNDKKDVMIKCYLESFGLYGEPDPRLSKPLSFNSPCSCQIKFSAQIRCFFMFNNVVANVEYCNCKNLFETLMVMQLLPSSTKSPRLAVHFGLLSFLHKLKMAAGVSNHSFTGVINEFGLQLAGFNDDYSAISKVLHAYAKKKIEKAFPSLASCNTQYAVPIFHAHAHNMHCQMQYNPRYIDHFGLTDGEGIERFWSYTSQFIAMTRSMSKDRRQLLLTGATIHYAEEKMKETPGHIRRKYKECLLSIQKLNMSINEFQRLEFQWKQLFHSTSTRL